MYVERAGSSAATSSGRSAPGGQLPHDHRVHVRAVEAPGRGEHLGDPVGDRLGSALSGELLDGPRLREQIRSCEPSHTSCLGMVQHLSPPRVAAARSRRPALAGSRLPAAAVRPPSHGWGRPGAPGRGALGVPGVVVPVELVPEGVVERELTKGAVLTTGVLVEPGFAHLLRQINQAQLGLLASSTRHRCSKLVSFIARPQWFWVDALIYLRSTRFQAG